MSKGGDVFSFENLQGWLTLLALIIGLANTAWQFLTKDVRASAAKIKEHGKDLAEHDRRIQTIESELKHLPSKDEVAKLNIAIAEMRGDIKELDGHMESVTHTVRRIEDYLLKGEKR